MPDYTINVNVLFHGEDAAEVTVSSPICECEPFRVWNNGSSRLFCRLSDIEDRIAEEFRIMGINYPRHLIILPTKKNHDTQYMNAPDSSYDSDYKVCCFIRPNLTPSDFQNVIYSFTALTK